MIALFLIACDEGEPSVSLAKLSVEFAEAIPTVMTVTWTTDAPTKGSVTYGVVGEETYETPQEAEATKDHSVLVLGMPAGSDVVLLGHDDADGETKETTVTTGDYPPDWPGWTVTVDEPTWTGWIVVGLAGRTGGALILDNHSRPVWWWSPETPSALVTRAIPSMDGLGVYALPSETQFTKAQSVTQVSWQGVELGSRGIDGLTHDFLEREPGVITGLAIVEHDLEDRPCTADAIYEFTFESEPTLIWDAMDDYADVDIACPPEGDPTASWTFLNAIDWDEASGQYRVESRQLSTITAVDRASGKSVFSVGQYGTIRVPDDQIPTEQAHQFQFIDDEHLLWFDDGTHERGYTRLVEFELDHAAGIANTIWQYVSDPPLEVGALGDVERLENGNTLANWSAAGRLSEVDPNGKTVWQVDSSLATAFGYQKRVESLYASQW